MAFHWVYLASGIRDTQDDTSEESDQAREAGLDSTGQIGLGAVVFLFLSFFLLSFFLGRFFPPPRGKGHQGHQRARLGHFHVGPGHRGSSSIFLGEVARLVLDFFWLPRRL